MNSLSISGKPDAHGLVLCIVILPGVCYTNICCGGVAAGDAPKKLMCFVVHSFQACRCVGTVTLTLKRTKAECFNDDACTASFALSLLSIVGQAAKMMAPVLKQFWEYITRGRPPHGDNRDDDHPVVSSKVAHIKTNHVHVHSA